MVKHIGFTYSDIKKMTRKERLAFNKLYVEELNTQKENMENAKNQSK
jgi:hypothetical protein